MPWADVLDFRFRPKDSSFGLSLQGSPDGQLVYRVCLNDGVTEESFHKALYYPPGISPRHPLPQLPGQLEKVIRTELFERFGQTGTLVLDSDDGAQADEYARLWRKRLLKRELQDAGLPEFMAREDVDSILDELYVVHPVLEP